MAPEIADQSGEYTEKVDVWAAGLILYELLNFNLKILFHGESVE